LLLQIDRQSIEKGRVGLGPSPTLLDYDGFRELLSGMAKWAVGDSPTPPPKDQSIDKQSYFGSVRRREASLSPWGYGNTEPADHEFMQRLFRRWDVNMTTSLTLQDVV
jgi:hypothetical protein